ncbi:MAG: cell envelope protein SmpA [Rhodanobacter sp. 68-29]|uniref:outer membrane protein assembly factor BamE n=1 Tax=Rhodanobacter sp. PCA2 TaxID=2006117 RepID=UPI00086ACCA6|nr:outer membrane protein assembly factor BamE [Rhodanobacter sp. PCA2]MBA2078516.1 cell envelope protein SmpA [Rhodanobacter sp. PCA2]MBN8921572.1 outer membrane protein assembly factor BamE [Rhodanobacter sp.]ODV27913.1 MAG: cell envelope protein SmpA [Rhodanobacter sp. SCN 68-63]OJY61421.1 MAG: cell envelope protein SmpA [Rhodanobacter sp. 68-29]
MHKLITLPVVALLGLAVAGCHLVYTPDVRQGNLLDKTIDEQAVNQLKPGLTKRQVLLLVGTPSVAAPFDQNRWDYTSTFSHRGGPMQVSTMTLYFENDTLARVEGNPYLENNKNLLKESKKYHVDYPIDESKGDKDVNGKDDKGSGTGIDGAH